MGRRIGNEMQDENQRHGWRWKGLAHRKTGYLGGHSSVSSLSQPLFYRKESHPADPIKHDTALKSQDHACTHPAVLPGYGCTGRRLTCLALAVVCMPGRERASPSPPCFVLASGCVGRTLLLAVVFAHLLLLPARAKRGSAPNHWPGKPG